MPNQLNQLMTELDQRVTDAAIKAVENGSIKTLAGSPMTETEREVEITTLCNQIVRLWLSDIDSHRG